MIPLGYHRRERRSWSWLCFNLQHTSWEVVKPHRCFGLWGRVCVCGPRCASSPTGMLGGGFWVQSCRAQGAAELCPVMLVFIGDVATPGSVPGYPSPSVWWWVAGAKYGVFLGKKCACTPLLLADVKGGEVVTLLLPGCSSSVRLVPEGRRRGCYDSSLTGGWQWQKRLLCASQAEPPPHRLGLPFRRPTHFMPCCIGFVRKKHFSPRNGTNNDGVEDNFNDTVLALVHGFREIHPSQNSDHFRTRVKSFRWLPADGRLRKCSTQSLDLHWISWLVATSDAGPLCGQQSWQGSLSQNMCFAFRAVICYFPDLCKLFFSSKVPYRCLK